MCSVLDLQVQVLLHFYAGVNYCMIVLTESSYGMYLDLEGSLPSDSDRYEDEAIDSLPNVF
jgi:hypothetical protein